MIEVDDRLWQLHCCRTLLGVIDTNKKRTQVQDLLVTKEPSPTKLYAYEAQKRRATIASCMLRKAERPPSPRPAVAALAVTRKADRESRRG